MKAVASAVLLAVIMALAVGHVLAQSNSSDDLQEKFQGAIGGWLGFFEESIGWVSVSLLDFMKHAIKATYFTIGVLGFVLWASGISKFSGKRLLMGAVALALISEILL